MQGSVIALGYVDFTTGAPTHAVDAALEQLHTNGATNYAESKLPAKWGWLLNLSMGQNRTELLQDNSGDVQIHTMNYPSGQGPPGTPPSLKLSMTATIAIAVGSIVAVLSGCCIIFLWRRKKAKKERERERERQVKVVQQQKGSGKDSRASGYLHDLDGMTGVDDSISGKTGTIKVRHEAVRVKQLYVHGRHSKHAPVVLAGSATLLAPWGGAWRKPSTCFRPTLLPASFDFSAVQYPQVGHSWTRPGWHAEAASPTP